MKIRAGEYVKCYLNNGTAVEGELIDWSADMVQVRSSADDSISIIFKPSDNIFLVKILAISDRKENSTRDIATPVGQKLPNPDLGLSNYGLPGFLQSKISK